MDKQNQICGDGALLLGYAAGVLGEEDSSRIAEHVNLCTTCQQLLEENEALMRAYRSISNEAAAHPTPEDLTHFVEGPSLSPSLDEIRGHVSECDECGEVVQVLRKVHKDEKAVGLLDWLRVTADHVGTWWSRGGKGLPSWLTSPIPAYVLLLLMIYPAFLGLSELGNMREQMETLESPVLLTSPLPLETDAQRGAEAPNVTIRRSGRHEVLTFFVPIASERYLYRVELKHRNGVVFSDPDAKSFDGVGTFALLLPRGALSSGDYELVVEEHEHQAAHDAQPVSTVSFSFSVSTQ
jgi:hypothetical protein